MIDTPPSQLEGARFPATPQSPLATGSTQVVSTLVSDADQIGTGSDALADASPTVQPRASPIACDSVRHTAGGHSPAGVTLEDVIAFGGIRDPLSSGKRFSHRIQDQPDADDIQMGRAMRAAKLRDIEVHTGMSVNTSCSILHFSEHDIIDKANNLGISLGSNDKETAKSINDLLDLAMDLIRHLAAAKPMNEVDINDLGVNELQSLYEDLVPTEGLDAEEEDMVTEGYVAPLQPEATPDTDAQHVEEMKDKPKKTWKRKVYPTSAVRRSARVKQKKKIP